MKLISFKTFLAFGIVVISFASCQKDESVMQDDSDYETLNLKSAKSLDFMVLSKSETLPDGFVAELSNYGKVVRSIPEIGLVVVNTSNSNFEKQVAKLANVQSVVPDLVVKCIEPVNYTVKGNPLSIGSDEPDFDIQWGLDAINAPEAWNAGFTGKGAKVFILDSGIDAEHPDLSPNLNTALSTSFIDGEDYNIAPGFYFNHGTHVAGIIAAADNQLGIIGVAPNTEIVAVKVLSEYTGSGAFSAINAGIVYAANNGADVINMSLGAALNKNGFYWDENNELQKVPAVYILQYVLAQQRAVDYAIKKGAVVVAAAGNGGQNADGNGSLIYLPADLSKVITVSATAPNYWINDYINGTPDVNFDIPASYTNIGKSLIDIAAPGGDFDFYDAPYWHYDMVISTISDGWGWAAGTSMASPHVAGVAALIIAKNGGDISPQEVTKQLLKTADKIEMNGKSSYFGNGRLNAFRAVTE